MVIGPRWSTPIGQQTLALSSQPDQHSDFESSTAATPPAETKPAGPRRHGLPPSAAELLCLVYAHAILGVLLFSFAVSVLPFPSDKASSLPLYLLPRICLLCMPNTFAARTARSHRVCSRALTLFCHTGVRTLKYQLPSKSVLRPPH